MRTRPSTSAARLDRLESAIAELAAALYPATRPPFGPRELERFRRHCPAAAAIVAEVEADQLEHRQEVVT